MSSGSRIEAQPGVVALFGLVVTDGKRQNFKLNLSPTYPQLIHSLNLICPHDPKLSTKIIKAIHNLSTKNRVVHNVIRIYPQDNFFRN